MPSKILLFTAMLLSLLSCNKYLEEKSDDKLVIPSTLSDLQALMDRTSPVTNADPYSLSISSNEYYLTDDDWVAYSYSDYDKNMYKWDRQDIFAPRVNDWSYLYQVIYIANTVLTSITSMEKNTSNENDWNNTIGQAYFYRGKYFFDAATVWSKSFDSTTMATDLGIPIRLDPDFNIPSVRGTLQDTYNQIISDLKEAADYLPVTSVHVMRPSKAAAYGMLARAYLFMRDYNNALKYADSVLSIKDDLMDFNSLDSNAAYPISEFNLETIYYSSINVPSFLSPTRAKIDSAIFNLYDKNDLRKAIFFGKNTDSSIAFKGSYTAYYNQFSGIAVDEQLLIRSECNCRSGNLTKALEDLNYLRKKRTLNASAFLPVTVSEKDSLLKIILKERQKELLMRGLWWPDVKRLNKEGAGITLHRHLLGKDYTLSPNSSGFVLPIPEDIIQLTGMKQNE